MPTGMARATPPSPSAPWDSERDPRTQEVTIGNVAPTATVSAPRQRRRRQPLHPQRRPITDPGADTAAQYTIAWGDGLTDSFTAARMDGCRRQLHPHLRRRLGQRHDHRQHHRRGRQLHPRHPGGGDHQRRPDRQLQRRCQRRRRQPRHPHRRASATRVPTAAASTPSPGATAAPTASPPPGGPLPPAALHPHLRRRLGRRHDHRQHHR